MKYLLGFMVAWITVLIECVLFVAAQWFLHRAPEWAVSRTSKGGIEYSCGPGLAIGFICFSVAVTGFFLFCAAVENRKD